MFYMHCQQFCYHLVSPCSYCLSYFHLPVKEWGQPWHGLCLHQGCIAQSGEGKLTFLSRFAHSCLTLASMTILCIFGAQWLLGPRNCANMSLGQQSFPARITHCAIPIVSSQTELSIAQFWQSVSQPPNQNCATFMIIYLGMLQVSSHVHFGF